MPKSRQRKNHKKKVQQRRNKILAERKREMQEYVKKMEEAQKTQAREPGRIQSQSNENTL